MPIDSAAPRLRVAGPVRYKVVETSSVTDESLETIVNDLVAQGWTFEGMQFAMRESSKRPAMAFVLFTRPDAEGTAEGEHGAS
ncbi:MAG: hypothetical protein NVS2B9_14430 [Myxococcales bacterium]